jgi:hypothetical protein
MNKFCLAHAICSCHDGYDSEEDTIPFMRAAKDTMPAPPPDDLSPDEVFDLSEDPEFAETLSEFPAATEVIKTF